MIGPFTGNDMAQYDAYIAVKENIGFSPAGTFGGVSGLNDFFYTNDYPFNFVCWVQAGTNNVLLTGTQYWCNGNGGTVECGGGGVGN